MRLELRLQRFRVGIRFEGGGVGVEVGIRLVKS